MEVVAIPSNRVNVSYSDYVRFKREGRNQYVVAIPSNRVNVSYCKITENNEVNEVY